MEQDGENGAPGFMIVKRSMERALKRKGKTVADFANELELDMKEAYGVLSGEKTGVDFARRFIRCYGADYAHKYIDWRAMGMADPYETIMKREVDMRAYDDRRCA